MLRVRAVARVLCPAAAVLWLAACSSVDSEDAVDVADWGTAGSGTGGSGGTAVGGTSAEPEGGTGALPETIEPKTVTERCAEQDSELAAARPLEWDVASHCKEAAPDYERLFGPEIKRLDIVVTPEAYADMEQDLDQLMYGDGAGGEGPGPQPSGCAGLQPGDPCQDDFGGGAGVCTDSFGDLWCYVAPPASETEPCNGRVEQESCTVGTDPGSCFSDGMTLFCVTDGSQPPTDGGYSDTCAQSTVGSSCQLGGSVSQGVCTQSGRLLSCQGPLDPTAEPPTPLDSAVGFWPRDPKYVEATLRFEGQEWTHVGYRYQGDYDLASAAPYKRPFRLQLDELEQDYPEITDQRLYGFKELSFSPGGNTEPSYVRQVLSTEMFARAGVPTARSTLIQVYLDTGDGPEVLGLYAMTEVPGDPFTKRVFDDKSGCLYEPDGLGAHLLAHHPESLHPRSDACPVDQIDVDRLITALNAEIVDRAVWRERLGQAIQLPALVRFFAVNQASGNWDTYGAYAHNYFLYGKSTGGPLNFVPWDFNLGMEAWEGSDFSLDGFPGEWPLIQAVARDAELYSAYHVALEEITAREYESGLLAQRVSELSAQVRPLLAEEGADVVSFDDEIARIQANIDGACDSLREYLDSRGFSDAYQSLPAPAPSH